MMLQKMCDVSGGIIDPERRNRYEQWKPKRDVYDNCKTTT